MTSQVLVTIRPGPAPVKVTEPFRNQTESWAPARSVFGLRRRRPSPQVRGFRRRDGHRYGDAQVTGVGNRRAPRASVPESGQPAEFVTPSAVKPTVFLLDSVDLFPLGRDAGEMLARQRQELILQQVHSSGGVRVSDLVESLGVSDMTVRRDIEALARRGLVARVHGGATSAATTSAQGPSFPVRSSYRAAEKEAIARAAAALVEPGASVAVSGGTTTHAVARELSKLENLTVVTNSLPVAELLHREGTGTSVVLTGGERNPSDALVGPVAVGALRTLHVDWLFLGVHGVDARAGFTTTNLLEAETDRALIASARRVVVTADSSKWGIVGLSSIARLDEVDVLVTDDGLDPDAANLARSRLGRLVLAPPGP
jgi:DeoR/GlpR family transcriptional regulator of sugar metabolism